MFTWSSSNHFDVSLLEAVVGASDAKEEEGEEDDGADDQQDLELAQRLQGPDLFADRKSGIKWIRFYFTETENLEICINNIFSSYQRLALSSDNDGS